MIVVYNPKDGAPIKNYIFEGVVKDPHYPDKYEYVNAEGKPVVSNGLMQYDDKCGEAILNHFAFLTRMSPEEAAKIINRPADTEFKCDYPECGFSTHTRIAFEGHKRKHGNQQNQDSKPVVDPSVIPVSGGRTFITPTEQKRALQQSKFEDIQNGADKDSVEWYGEGSKIESFGAVKPAGQGHFVG